MTEDEGQFQDLNEDYKGSGFSCDSVVMKAAEDRQPWLRMEGLSASWGGEEGKLTLHEINFEVNKVTVYRTAIKMIILTSYIYLLCVFIGASSAGCVWSCWFWKGK